MDVSPAVGRADKVRKGWKALSRSSGVTPWPPVGDDDHRVMLALPPRDNRDFGAGRRVLDRVADQIADRLDEPILIAFDPDLIVEMGHQIDGLAAA